MSSVCKMKRFGLSTFLRRVWSSVFNGLFWPKMLRHFSKLRRVRTARQAWVDRFCPVVPGRVVFASFSGGCSCNPRAVARELAKRRPDVEIVWLLDPLAFKARGGRADTGRAVLKSTWAEYKMIATAAVLVENAQLFVGASKPVKRTDQLYINTWHGSLGIKRLETARRSIRAAASRRSQRIDLLLTNSTFEEEIFRASLFPETPFARVGHPRNDVFFRPEAERNAIRDSVRRSIGIDATTKVALYAPTFREDAFADGTAFDFGAWADALAARFGGRWVVAVKLHPHDAHALADGLFTLPKGILDVSDFEDIQDLLVTADVGVTDYSSWIFDFLLCGRPGFIYAPDKEDYDRSRGFYYPLEEAPFPVSTDQAGLCESIRAFDADRFAVERRRFLKRRGCMEDGHASARVVDMIVTHLDRLAAKKRIG